MCYAIRFPALIRPNSEVGMASRMGDFVNVKAPPPSGIIPPGPPPGWLNGRLNAVVPP